MSRYETQWQGVGQVSLNATVGGNTAKGSEEAWRQVRASFTAIAESYYEGKIPTKMPKLKVTVDDVDLDATKATFTVWSGGKVSKKKLTVEQKQAMIEALATIKDSLKAIEEMPPLTPQKEPIPLSEFSPPSSSPRPATVSPPPTDRLAWLEREHGRLSFDLADAKCKGEQLYVELQGVNKVLSQSEERREQLEYNQQRLGQDLRNLEIAVKEKGQQVEAAEQELVRARSELKDASFQKDQLQNQLSAGQGELEGLRQANGQLPNKIQEAERAVDETRAALAEGQKQTDRLAEQVTNQEKALGEVRAERDRVQDELQCIQNQLRLSQQANELMQADLDVEKSESSRLQKELEGKRCEIQGLQKEIQANAKDKESIRTLETELEHTRNEITALEGKAAQVDPLKQEIQKLKHEKEELDAQRLREIEEGGIAARNHKREEGSLQEKIDALENKLAGLNGVKEELRKAEQSQEKLQIQVSQLESKLDIRDGRNQRQCEQNHGLKDAVERLESQHERDVRELTKLKKEQEAAKRQEDVQSAAEKASEIMVTS